MNHISEYILRKQEDIYKTIVDDFNDLDNIANPVFQYFINNLKFHNYYLEIRENKDKYEEERFFNNFKKEYSLQGIDDKYLESLTKSKEIIINLIDSNNINELFFTFFANARIKHGKETTGEDKEITKELGSFFAKLIHTFKPQEYCALDNPIKNYFKLQRESFLIAFFCINNAYKKWCSNSENVSKLRSRIREIDTESILNLDSLSDLKLLDMVYWHKANVQKK